MIKELTVEEITSCYGGVRLQERTYDDAHAVMYGIAAAAGTFFVCVSTNLLEMSGGNVVTSILIAVVVIAVLRNFYRNIYGKKYTIDLDYEYNP